MSDIRNILYIHGLDESVDSRTCQNIREILTECTVYSKYFDLFDITGTREKIESLIKERNIGTLIGNGLGAFFALLGKPTPFRIVINPLMCPHLDLSAKKVSQSVLDAFFELEKRTYGRTSYKQGNLHGGYSNTTFGIFGNYENVGYSDFFASLYSHFSNKGNNIVIIPDGKAELTKEQLTPALEDAFEYVKGHTFEGIKYLRNRNFEWTKENIAKIRDLDDFLRQKQKLLYEKVKEAEKSMKDALSKNSELLCGEFELTGKLCIEVPENAGKFFSKKIESIEPWLFTIQCSSYHPLEDSLGKDTLHLTKTTMPIPEGSETPVMDVCMSLYWLCASHVFSFQDLLELDKNAFYCSVKIENTF